MKTTLNAIREHRPCSSGWEKLLSGLGKTKSDYEPLPLLRILEINGPRDCLWAIRAVRPSKKRDRVARLIACDIAEEIALPVWSKHYPADKRPVDTIRIARLYAVGEATDEELAAAWAAASAAAWAAARAAASTAAWAAEWAAEWDAERAAASTAAWAAEWAAEWDAAGEKIASIIRRHLEDYK